VPEEKNYVLNPAHPTFVKLDVGDPAPFVLDPRLRR
jgi:RES domain-containing protein